MTRAELDEIRAANRARLGLAGMAGSVPGGLGADLLALAPPVRLTTEFPPLDVTYVPGQAQAPSSSGPGWGDWLTRHVVRPVLYVGPARIAPYERDADYSTAAKVLAALGLGLGVGLAGFTVARAIMPTRAA